MYSESKFESPPFIWSSNFVGDSEEPLFFKRDSVSKSMTTRPLTSSGILAASALKSAEFPSIQADNLNSAMRNVAMEVEAFASFGASAARGGIAFTYEANESHTPAMSERFTVRRTRNIDDWT